MSEFKIKCPNCGKILRLQDAPNINMASFTCPVCKTKHVVGQCQRVKEQPPSVGEETQYGPNPTRQSGVDTTTISGNRNGNNEVTRIGGYQSASIGTLVAADGSHYPLQMGINTIGRKAASSAATVQILTNDLTMSRSHAIIEVNNVGGQIMHTIKNGANKNPSYVNGIVIGPQDKLVLNNGAHIQMGNTNLTFKI